MEKAVWRILLVAFVLVLGCAIMYRQLKDRELERHKTETIGTLVSFAECGVLKCYDYRYVVGGKEFLGRLKSNVLIPECRYGGQCAGRRFRVLYSSADPGNSELDLAIEYKNETVDSR